MTHEPDGAEPAGVPAAVDMIIDRPVSNTIGVLNVMVAVSPL